MDFDIHRQFFFFGVRWCFWLCRCVRENCFEVRFSYPNVGGDGHCFAFVASERLLFVRFGIGFAG